MISPATSCSRGLGGPVAAGDRRGRGGGPWGGSVHYRGVGEVLHPEREPLEALEKLKIEMGSYDFSPSTSRRPCRLTGT